MHIPYTLPCQHSYCLEPCLLAQRTGENVQCFNCGKCYPFKEATRNCHLEALITKQLVEERRSLITACDACKTPSLGLRDCQHCRGRVCPSCYQSHYDQVVVAVKASVESISKARKTVRKRQNKLVKKSPQFSQLEEDLKSAIIELKTACDKSLARANVQLDGYFSEYAQSLVKYKSTAKNLKTAIQDASVSSKYVQKMNMCDLLKKRDELKDVPSLARKFLSTVRGLNDEPNPLGIEISKSYSSLIYPIQSLSLIEKEQDTSMSEKDEDDSIGDFNNSTTASTTNQIYVGRLTPKISHLQLKSHFSQYGAIKNVFIPPSRRFGYVTFANKESVLPATAQPFQFIENVKIEVKPFSPKQRFGSTRRRSNRRHSSSKKSVVESASNINPPKLSEAEQKKVFVGGILPFTTKDTVQSTMLKFGPIKRLDFMPQRGFAVVLFEQPATTDLALSTHWYDIDGKRVELLPYVSRKENDQQSPSIDSSSDLRRIFMGGINPKITEDEIKSSLSCFGLIEKVLINSLKGYALVTFTSVDAANEAIAKHWIIINDKKVELMAFQQGIKKGQKSKQRSESIFPISSSSSPSKILETNDDHTVEEVSKRKIYVEGIVPPINETMLKTYFSQYGAVIFCQITGQRACLIFESSKGVEAAMRALSHIVVGRSLKIASPASVSPKSSGIAANTPKIDVSVRKLIIKGISEDITYSVLRDYFSNYGPVDYGSVSGAEAWIVFKNAETATLVLNSQPHFIRGRQVSLQSPNNANSLRIETPYHLSGTGIDSTVIPNLGPLFQPDSPKSNQGAENIFRLVSGSKKLH
ncbi:unnamed protein product [Hymenolepis diminuta]|uniref:RRM domain-containing protein n=3 Tax=Hymenolepis diminuta TaxID=6216 RepID=A0A564Y6F4_HYMDI|nr:unnamed protein product [Hymenolepis diminuta]